MIGWKIYSRDYVGQRGYISWNTLDILHSLPKPQPLKMALITKSQAAGVAHQMSLYNGKSFVPAFPPNSIEKDIFDRFLAVDWENVIKQMTESFHLNSQKIHCFSRTLWVGVGYASNIIKWTGDAITEDNKNYWGKNLYQWNRGNQLPAHERVYSPDNGHSSELPAIELYKRQCKTDVVRVKRLVHPRFPFLVATPDGIAVGTNGFFRPIEIKTENKKTKAELLTDGNGLVGVNKATRSFYVRDITDGYLQMQLTMLVLNTRVLDLVYYVTDSSEIVVIPVHRVDEHIERFMRDLCKKYMMYSFPQTVEKICQFENNRKK